VSDFCICNMNNSQMTSRTIEEMVESLRKQVRLLQDFSQKAFIERNSDYFGEIANKLRILVVGFKSNTPLLLRLMEETGIQPKITLNGPPNFQFTADHRSGDKVSLEEFLTFFAIGMKVSSGDFVQLNKINFIRMVAEQAGGAHEDWKREEILTTILSSHIYIMGLPSSHATLKSIVQIVLHVADQFLTEYDSQKIGKNIEHDQR
jgi:hypothetical protein